MRNGNNKQLSERKMSRSWLKSRKIDPRKCHSFKEIAFEISAKTNKGYFLTICALGNIFT